MSTKQTTNTPTVSIAEQAKNLDAIAKNALSLSEGGSFENAFAVADAMNQLRDAITSDMMKRFMALQNTSLGFRTDKDPNLKNKQGEFNKPYTEEVVKECVIEAVLRGVQPVGNQFNIIANRTYITREGFEFKIKKLEGLSGFKPIIGIPKTAPGGAIVPCSGTWTYKGAKDKLDIEIPVRVNEGMGADAIIGKAQRKFLKRVFEQITGSSVPDGDIEDPPMRQIATPSGLGTESAAGPTPSLFPAGEPEAPKPAPSPDKLVQIKKLIADAQIEEADVLAWVLAHHRITADTLAELHPTTLDSILRNFGAILNRGK